MRSETETDREVDRDESGSPERQQNVLVGLEQQIDAIDRAIYGEAQTDSTEEELMWVHASPDNQLIRSLKQMTSLMAHMIEKEIKVAEKQIRAAEKVFHG
jgi:hypothetical protein